MTETQKLLADYAENGSETAFRELVGRYIDFVHSVATRLTGSDAHLAEDVCQMVFADLALQSRTLSRDSALGGWLHRHTCLVASTIMRGERRRQSRERQVALMNELPDYSEANLAAIAPVLDDAIDHLGDEDRAAIVLRFFERRDLRSVGEAMGTSENTARMRVSRALDKLHSLLKHHGVSYSAAGLGTALGASAVTAAPVGLAAGVSGAVLAGTVAGTGTALVGLKFMAMTKLKMGVAAIIVAGAATTFILQDQAQSKIRDQNLSLRRQVDQLAALAAENQGLSNRLARAAEPKPLTPAELSELLRLRSEATAQKRELADLQAAAVRTTNAAAAQTHLTRDAWTFAGYATPEATLQSVWWAQTHKDMKAFLNALAPEQRAQFEKMFAGKTEDEIMAAKADTYAEIQKVQGLRILKTKSVSDDQVAMTVYYDGADNWKNVQMKRFGNEWKISGDF
jgi:RNA polymerase sigma factor (sigma-70 family)